jgi:hypothetical protein
MKTTFSEALKIAHIHRKRITHSADYLKHVFPLSAETVSSLEECNLLHLEILTSRFAKLQTYCGS